jgi:hypothetical protein
MSPLLSLDDPRWTEMKSGYRIAFDARPLLQRFVSSENRDSCWKEVWDELHHQGDVDTASYAVLPYLVDLARQQRRDWNLYAYAAIVTSQVGRGLNPSVPDFIKPAFDDALRELFEFALSDLRAGSSLATTRFILSFIAAYAQGPELSQAILNLDYFEEFGARVLEAERNAHN